LIGKREANSVQEAREKLGLTPMSEDELKGIISEVVKENTQLLKSKGETAFGPLMGEVMKKVRGRVDGEVVSKVLRASIETELADPISEQA
jgi:glutamyl-tRNA(Gln) amidotransferase subunit E